MSQNYSNLKKPKQQQKQSAIEWLPIIAPPDNYAPKSFMAHEGRKFGDPNLSTYKNKNGDICFYIERREAIDNKNNKKSFIPHSLFYRADNPDIQEWKNLAWKEDKPLFQEHLITEAAQKILICEGEKSVKFCNDNEYLKSNYLAVCWSGGSNNVHQTSFKALKGKEVYLLPDNDNAGLAAMHEVAKILIEEDITENINWINYDTSKLAEGWDIADSLPPNETIENFLNATEYEPDLKTWKEIDKVENDRAAKKTIKELVNKFIYVREAKAFWDVEFHTMLDEKELSDYYKHITKTGRGVGNLLLQSKETIKVIKYFSHAGLKPGVLELKANQILDYPAGKYFNIYRPNTIELIDEDVSEYFDYYKWLFGPDKWEVIEQFIAFMVQHPGQKILWVLLLISIKEGVGKNLLMMIISACLGRQNVYENVSVAQLTSKHSTIMEGTQCVCLNELSLSGGTKDKIEISNQIKSLFTDRETVIDRKNKNIIKIPNFTNFLVFSNDPRCVKLSKTTRRYYIAVVKKDDAEVEKRITDLGEKIVDIAVNRPGVFLNYFKKVKITNPKMFYANAPRTDDLEELIENTKDDIFYYLDDLLPRFKREGIMTRGNLAAYLQGQQTKIPFWNYAHLDTWLKENCTKWNNNAHTKQGIYSDQRVRFYLLEDRYVESIGHSNLGPGHEDYRPPTVFNKNISKMTETELGDYKSLIENYNQKIFNL